MADILVSPTVVVLPTIIIVPISQLVYNQVAYRIVLGTGIVQFDYGAEGILNSFL